MAKRTISPYELDVYAALFASVAEEMGVVLMRSAFSPNIKERRDFSCAVFDRQGRMISHAAHIPVHLGSTPMSVEAARAKRALHRGDMVLLNDPFAGGTHLPDITLVAPVFIGRDRDPEFFVVNRAHHADVGGLTPGSMGGARETCQEGLRLPPVKLVKGGALMDDILDIVLANVRTPEERRADLAAQIASNLKGTERLTRLHEQYGRPVLRAATGALLDYGERSMRALIERLPDGRYEHHDFLDDDGVGGDPVRIAVSIEIRGDEVSIDFEGSDPQTVGPMNANAAITRSAVLYVFRSLVGGDLPANDGAMRPIQISLPERSVVNASWPAAVAAGNVETSQRLVDVLLGAMAKACPEAVPASSQGTMNNVTLGGIHPSDGRPFAYYETLGGGAGASSQGAGASGIQVHMTNTLNTPIEALESALPLRIVRQTLRRGSGGGGRSRGGDGIVREIEVLAETEVALVTERRAIAPPGLEGGSDGKPGRNYAVTGQRRRSLPGKAHVTLSPGDRVVIETPGGGGYGKPQRRRRTP